MRNLSHRSLADSRFKTFSSAPHIIKRKSDELTNKIQSFEKKI